LNFDIKISIKLYSSILDIFIIMNTTIEIVEIRTQTKSKIKSQIKYLFFLIIVLLYIYYVTFYFMIDELQ